MLVNRIVAKLLKEVKYDYPVTHILDSSGKIYNTIDNELFDTIDVYPDDLKRYEADDNEEYFPVPYINDVVKWLRTNYKLHVEVFINEEHNDYCCRCWSIASEKKFKLLCTRVAYNSPYEAWNGILESTLKYYLKL